MKVGSSIIAFLGLMAVCSCSAPKSEMSTLVNNSLQIATVQSKLMAENLLNEEEKLPRIMRQNPLCFHSLQHPIGGQTPSGLQQNHLSTI